MKNMIEVVAGIPSEYRRKILTEWLPNAKPTLSNEFMKMLFETYFIYVDPNGVKNADCQRCVMNVLENWLAISALLLKAEQDQDLIEQL